jgi:hypothetical protein
MCLDSKLIIYLLIIIRTGFCVLSKKFKVKNISGKSENSGNTIQVHTFFNPLNVCISVLFYKLTVKAMKQLHRKSNNVPNRINASNCFFSLKTQHQTHKRNEKKTIINSHFALFKTTINTTKTYTNWITVPAATNATQVAAVLYAKKTGI